MPPTKKGSLVKGKMPKGISAKLNYQVGPLPLWGWGAVAVGGFLLWRHYQAAQAAAATDTTSSGIGTQGFSGSGGGGGDGTPPPSGRHRHRRRRRPRRRPPLTPTQLRHRRRVRRRRIAPPSPFLRRPADAPGARSSYSTFGSLNVGASGGGGAGPIRSSTGPHTAPSRSAIRRGRRVTRGRAR